MRLRVAEFRGTDGGRGAGGGDIELGKPKEGAFGRFYLLVLRRRTLARQAR